MKICQYNCQSLKNNKSTINFYLNNYNVDICLLSEIFKYEDSDPNYKIINYNVIVKTRKDNYGGTAIAFRKNIKVRQIKFTTDYDILIAQTTNLSKNFTIVSVYFPPKVRLVAFKNEIEKLLILLTSFSNVILAGDFNARNRCWGDYVDNRKGVSLKFFTDLYGLSCLNSGESTFFKSLDGGVRGSVLDLTFANFNADFKWSVLPIYFSGSHHHPILLDMHGHKAGPQKFLAKFKLLKILSSLNLADDFDSIGNSFKSQIKN